MAKPELGNKHQCQHCGARFFDLNRNPITCPKCGTVFQATALSRAVHHAAVADDEDAEAVVGADVISLEDADAVDDKIVVEGDEDVEIEVADDTFLEEEEEDSDDVGDLIDDVHDDDEER
ncbi:TIGR02300 family protein [Methylocapsa acidiphila]|uniref:TIGR02300 family protein n=1 Tax=Methylocapsa acidiphila TaxID=133552 RepID=UPI00040000D4|nr:TIGR02300 family protein [Methylocapsa acidiphila]